MRRGEKMNDQTVFAIVGGLSAVTGCLLLVRERRMFQNSISTQATVVDYESYLNEHRICMYTMVVEYTLLDGTLVRASEQAASNRKKHPVGTKLQIIYSSTKTDMFRSARDHSRMIGIVGMIIVGIALLLIPIFKPFE